MHTDKETYLAMLIIDKREEVIQALRNYDEGGKFLDVLVDIAKEIIRVAKEG